MKQQTVMWTALPNGIANGKLRLSVFVSPRLQTDEGGAKPRLSQFPDFVEWPARIAQAQFQVKFGNRPPIAATRVAPPNAELGAELYRAVLNADTYVEPFAFPKLQDRAIRSFAVRNVHAHVKQLYQSAVLESPTVVPKLTPKDLRSQPLGRLLDDLVPPAPQRAALRNQLETQLRGAPIRAFFNTPADDAASVRGPVAVQPPAGAVTPQVQATRAAADFEQFNMFHLPAARRLAGERIRPPVEPPEMDFHRIFSSLGQYPAVMRLLGFVIDLEVPYDPALQGQTTVSVIPTWTPTMPTTTVTPRTRCIIGPNQFQAQPRGDGDIADGMLKLDDETRFEIGQVDVDGAAAKVMNAAEQARNGGDGEEKEASLPSLRSAGIWVARTNRAHQVASVILPRLVAQNATLVNLEKKQPGDVDDLYAEDLVRGYRVDVLDEATGQWRSLCQREGKYRFRNDQQGVNRTLSIEDEGWVSSATTETTEEDDDLYVHETLFTWDGWSLVAPRPMKPLPQEGVPKATPLQYGLDTSFTPTPGSLPRLRFGHSYRLRARVVDLAGNSLPLDAADGSHASESIQYARHEPVATPIIVPRTDLSKSPGESPDRIVIRSYNDSPAKDSQPSSESSERHIAPPKTTENMAERHGKFDGPQGMKGDAATYQLIIENDGTLGEVEQAEQLQLPYLPDPVAAGATIRSIQIDVAPGPEDRVVKVPYQGEWPDVLPFRIRVVEQHRGGTEPEYQPGPRRLIIPLPKAEIAEIWISSYLDEAALSQMGVYQWAVDAAAAPALRRANLPAGQLRQIRRQLYVPGDLPNAAKAVSLEPPKQQQIQLVSTAALKGILWLVTPYRKLTLVHAVQQPLITPDLRNLKARKALGNTYATLEGKFPISGKSTIKVDILAEWEEPIDPIGEPTWRTLNGKAHVVELPVDYTDTEIVMGAPQEPQRIAPQARVPAGSVPISPAARAKLVPLAEASLAPQALGVPAAPLAEPEKPPIRLSPRLLILNVLGPRHEFGDTKYRRVTYKAVATTRFREYFPFSDDDIASGKARITRESEPVTVDVLNSARPLPPRVRYVIPTFGWEVEKSPDGVVSKRLGGGLRVYLERPWFSSGEGELLGVVLPSKQPVIAGRTVRPVVGGGISESLQRYVTQMGADPIFASGSVKPAPDPADFPLAVETEDGLSLDEVPGARVAVVGHKVQFDAARQVWFCDIQLNPQNSYYPFVRLALARYQPKSVKTDDTDCKLSPVVLSDFAQLPPDRTAAVKYDAANRVAQVTVTGLTYSAPYSGSEMEVTLETRQPNVPGPLGWVPVPDATIELSTRKVNDVTTAWTGRVTLPGDQPPTRFRLVVKEYERFRSDEGTPSPGAAMVANIPTSRRLVYADVLPLGGPAPEAAEE